jgi:hypothetical protein
MPNESLAADVIARLQADELFTVASEHGSIAEDSDASHGSDSGSKSDVVEGLVGQTAGDSTCTVPR